MNWLDRPRNRLLAGCAVAVAVLVLALLVATVGSSATGTISFELRKHLIQFLLIVALGAVVAVVVDALKRRAEAVERERQYAIDTMTSLLDRLDASYRAVKRARQSFRLVPMAELSRQYYVDAMWTLSDEKKDVEKLWRDMEVLANWLPELTAIWPRVKAMEDYLNPLEDEWETLGSIRDGDFHAETLEKLRTFSSKWRAGDSDFHLFRAPYYEARSKLMSLLAEKRTGEPNRAED